MIEYKTVNFAGNCILEGKEIYLSGLGSVYNIEDKQKDIVDPKAFQTYKTDWEKGQKLPLMCLEHKILNPVGKWVECVSNEQGLHLVGRIVNSLPAGKVVAKGLMKGKKFGLSIGYEVIEAERQENGVRLIKKAKLYEVSIVEQPANEKAIIDGVYIKQENR